MLHNKPTNQCKPKAEQRADATLVQSAPLCPPGPPTCPAMAAARPQTGHVRVPARKQQQQQKRDSSLLRPAGHGGGGGGVRAFSRCGAPWTGTGLWGCARGSGRALWPARCWGCTLTRRLGHWPNDDDDDDDDDDDEHCQRCAEEGRTSKLPANKKRRKR